MSVYLLELKTTSEDCGPGSLYQKRLTLDLQCSMYISAAREMGYDAEGIVYDIIRKSGLRPLQKGAETPESYEQRIIDQIGKEPDRYYGRVTIVRTSDEITEHDADAWNTHRLIRDAYETNRYPRYTGSCVAYGSTCVYWPVCAEGADINDNSLYATRAAMPGARHLKVLSASSLNTWRQCPRKYYYAHELRRRPVAPPSKPLVFGRLMHKAIEAWNLSKGDLAKALGVCTELSDPHDRAHARALMRGYDARWFDAKLDVIATEKNFIRELRDTVTGLPSTTHCIGGIVDAIVRTRA